MLARFFVAAVAASMLASPAQPIAAAPPRVVKASPDNGNADVDPATRELRITFDQPMDPGGRSIVGGGETFPELIGQPRWRDGNRTFVMRLKLQPEHDYWLSINNQRFTNFRNRAGEPAVPYPIAFRTAAAGAANDLPGAEQADDAAANLEAYEIARDAVENAYSYRDRLDVDWGQRFEAARKRLIDAKSPQDFAKRLAMVLAKAEDKHVWLTVEGQHVPSFVRPAVPNANFKLLPRLVPKWQMHGKHLATGDWGDGVKYLAVDNWTQSGVADDLGAALAAVQDAQGLIIDVRSNGGGDERLAQQVAGCFTDERLLYGKNVYRDPQSPTGFTDPPYERWLEPNAEGPRIKAKAVVLTGPVVMSSCESFLLMMKAAGATLVGDRSQGSSGNPKPHDLGNGVVLFLPSWKDMTPAGDELEGVGIPPDVPVKATARDFQRGDPVLEAALKLLRKPSER
ncbi:MAG: hypothetical protein CMJ58_17285 [Planctomycetaceae bacterium]|nr:hypothetical protein [Planctomycetaceae bacterium]